jgi:phospholipid/cholesterol/gamma-HCH transport system ATP-binding protein
VSAPAIIADNLTMAFGERVIQRDVSFVVEPRQIFVIMGGSGCGKSTLLRSLVGLVRPAGGDVLYEGRSFWAAAEEERSATQRRLGVLFQSGALWSSLTLSENVGLPLSQYTKLSDEEIADVVAFKLALVGLRGFEEFYPSEISGGMKKRAGLARAIALDPDILFFDEPSAGLDPISSKRLDELILQLRDALGATIIVVTHELASIFAIADNSVFLDAETHTAIAHGNPNRLLHECENPKVREFLRRGERGVDGDEFRAGASR